MKVSMSNVRDSEMEREDMDGIYVQGITARGNLCCTLTVVVFSSMKGSVTDFLLSVVFAFVVQRMQSCPSLCFATEVCVWTISHFQRNDFYCITET